jgi:hypothetical protein
VVLLAAAVAYAANPPTPSSRLDAVLNQGLTSDPVRRNSTALSTTPIEAVATDLTGVCPTDLTQCTLQKTLSSTQIIVVTNLDTANRVCVGSTDWNAADDDCDTLCGSSGINCTAGDSAMGSVIPPGQSRDFRYAGTKCVCVVGSAASTDVQVERIVR